ncbi:MAG: PH domain-containing protein [Acidimicrobiales bacterium]|nr:PH domain-containing protein [Acidimicrobiales bacterium]
MAYPKNLLIPGEEVVLDLRPHWWFLTPRALVTTAAIVVGTVVFAKTGGFGDDQSGVDQTFRLLFGVAVLASLVWFLQRLAKWATTEFVLTNKRVIYRYGVIGKNGKEIPLDKINTVFFDQTVFERVIGCGTVAMESAGESGKDSFTHIRKPSLVQGEIYRQMEEDERKDHEAIGRAARGGGGGGGLSVAEQLEKLHELHQSGALSDAEYEAQKAKLL